VNGTQNTINKRSASAKLAISKLVVLRICEFATTAATTRALPKNPTMAMSPNISGTLNQKQRI
jgi:hypothetical protein